MKIGEVVWTVSPRTLTFAWSLIRSNYTGPKKHLTSSGTLVQGIIFKD
jgi:hypothetical protein